MPSGGLPLLSVLPCCANSPDSTRLASGPLTLANSPFSSPMTLANSASFTPTAWPHNPGDHWPHDPGENALSWPHEGGDWQAFGPRSAAWRFENEKCRIRWTPSNKQRKFVSTCNAAVEIGTPDLTATAAVHEPAYSLYCSESVASIAYTR